MKQREFPQEVQEWLTAVEEYTAVSNVKAVMERCDKLEQYADKVQSDYIRGYSLYYRGYCDYYYRNDLEKGIESLSIAINCLIAEEEWELAARTYNELGNIADFQGDLSLAIDCFFKGLACCHEHNLGATTYYLESNIANIYIELGEPSNAVSRLLTCEELVKNTSNSIRALIYANITNCYIQLNELEKAEMYLQKLQGVTTQRSSLIYRVLILYLQTALLNAKKEYEARDKVIAEFQKLELTTFVVIDTLNELCAHAEMLLEIGYYEAFCKLVDQMDALTDTSNVRKKTTKLRLKYYKQINDQEKYVKMTVRYYELSESEEHQQNKVISHNILIRSYLDEEAAKRREIEKANQMLKHKSEKDALTGMNNRYKLSELSELAFQRAYANGLPLAIEIVDVDCFKEYNDNYGHQAGDECLIKIARAIQSMEQYAGVHTGRYGGDEFMIVYENYAQEDVQKMAEQLRTQIRNLSIEHKHSGVGNCVTVSQGIFQKIPMGNNKLWDFLYVADMALYAVKKKSRDSYLVAASLKEVNEFSQAAKREK